MGLCITNLSKYKIMETSIVLVTNTEAVVSESVINNFLEKTEYCLATFTPRPHIVCADGFRMSVQAGHGLYSSQDEETGWYNEVEVGYPNQVEELLIPYTNGYDDYTDQVYPYTPYEVVDMVIEKHGGLSHIVEY